MEIRWAFLIYAIFMHIFAFSYLTHQEKKLSSALIAVALFMVVRELNHLILNFWSSYLLHFVFNWKRLVWTLELIAISLIAHSKQTRNWDIFSWLCTPWEGKILLNLAIWPSKPLICYFTFYRQQAMYRYFNDSKLTSKDDKKNILKEQNFSQVGEGS